MESCLRPHKHHKTPFRIPFKLDWEVISSFWELQTFRNLCVGCRVLKKEKKESDCPIPLMLRYHGSCRFHEIKCVMRAHKRKTFTKLGKVVRFERSAAGKLEKNCLQVFHQNTMTGPKCAPCSTYEVMFFWSRNSLHLCSRRYPSLEHKRHITESEPFMNTPAVSKSD